jgi:hydrogenase expression/formation protein HypC
MDENMCLAVPSKIVEIKDLLATVDVDGVRREASLMLLEDVNIGDYVIIHAGFAISKVDEDIAQQALVDMRNMLDAADDFYDKMV